ncbi:MAG: hypothetical protein J6N21_22915 [Butyrivibrio sp.]|nr:hypothetical protein [Butyrivibrio sp.]
MKKISKFISASILSIAFIFNSVIPVFASTCDISAYAAEPNTASDTVNVGTDCYLYGYAACYDGGLFGNPCQWRALQYGALAPAGTGTYASFGQGTSYTNIMGMRQMVNASDLEYEKSAGSPHHYAQVNTRLYY